YGGEQDRDEHDAADCGHGGTSPITAADEPRESIGSLHFLHVTASSHGEAPPRPWRHNPPADGPPGVGRSPPPAASPCPRASGARRRPSSLSGPLPPPRPARSAGSPVPAS